MEGGVIQQSGNGSRGEPHRIYDVKRVQAFLVDETYVQVGSFEAWVWVAVEPIHRYILGIYLSRHQNILVAQLFLRTLVERYGKHDVYSDGGTWYPEACRALGLEHRLHSIREEPGGEGERVPEGQDRGVRRLLAMHEKTMVRPQARLELAQPLRGRTLCEEETHDV
jgi:transposase-like protein